MMTQRADQLIRRALGEEEEPKQPTEFHFGLIDKKGKNHKRTRDFSLLFRRTDGDPATHTAIARGIGFSNDHEAVRDGHVRWYEDTHLDRRQAVVGSGKTPTYHHGGPVDLKPTPDGKLHGVEFDHRNINAIEHAFLHIANHVPVGHNQVHVVGVRSKGTTGGRFTRGTPEHVSSWFRSGLHTRASALEHLSSLHAYREHQLYAGKDWDDDPDFDDDHDPYYENLIDKHRVKMGY